MALQQRQRQQQQQHLQQQAVVPQTAVATSGTSTDAGINVVQALETGFSSGPIGFPDTRLQEYISHVTPQAANQENHIAVMTEVGSALDLCQQDGGLLGQVRQEQEVSGALSFPRHQDRPTPEDPVSQQHMAGPEASDSPFLVPPPDFYEAIAGDDERNSALMASIAAALMGPVTSIGVASLPGQMLRQLGGPNPRCSAICSEISMEPSAAPWPHRRSQDPQQPTHTVIGGIRSSLESSHESLRQTASGEQQQVAAEGPHGPLSIVRDAMRTVLEGMRSGRPSLPGEAEAAAATDDAITAMLEMTLISTQLAGGEAPSDPRVPAPVAESGPNA